MIKQIDIHGQRVKLYSSDKGRTWSSSPQSIVAYGAKAASCYAANYRKRLNG